MFNNPQTWKWFVPAAIASFLLWCAIVLLTSAWQYADEVSALLGIFGLLGYAAAATNYWKLWSSHQSELFRQRQEALSVTPLVLLANSLQTMHPEAVRVLNRFGVRTSWDVQVNIHTGEREWTLKGTNVHFGFIEHVLSHSGTALFPKNRFSQGSKKWDPDGLIEDREQYDELERWMHSRLMVTRSHGEFRPAEFIPPWTPALILDAMGLTGDQELFRPDEEKVKELPAAAAGEKKKPEAKSDQHQVQELTEEEWQAIQKVTAEHAAKFQS